MIFIFEYITKLSRILKCHLRLRAETVLMIHLCFKEIFNARKGYDFDVLNELDDEDYIKQGAYN